MILNNGHVGGVGIDTGDIGHSLRFRASGSAYASRTFGTPTNNKKFTWSGWLKIGKLGVGMDLFGADTSSSNFCTLYIGSNDSLVYWDYSGSTRAQLVTSAVFRDPTVDYHIVLAVDVDNPTVADRAILYVDGDRITSFSTNTQYSSSLGPAINAAGYLHGIGRLVNGSSSGYLDGNLSRVCFIDGQALTPSSFGYLNTEINRWVTKSQSQVKAVVDAGGTNSFMLDFDNGSSLTTLGYDKSSKGNNWTLNNFSLTAGPSYDWMLDVPGNRYATLNPLLPSSRLQGGAIFNGNLSISTVFDGGAASSLATMPCSSKTYWEGEAVSNSGYGQALLGVANEAGVTLERWAGSGGQYSAYGVYGVAFDPATGYGWIRSPTGSWVTGDPETCVNPTFSVAASGVWRPLLGAGRTSGYKNTAFAHYNFGQRPFAFTPPTGFKSLCQANLPDIPAATLNPLNHAQVKLDTGANIKATCEAVFSGNCLEAIKDRANSNNWQWADIVRGLSAILQSNTTNAETTYSAPSGSPVGLVLKAGGAPVTNNAGSITSQVSANTDLGFSIVTATCTAAIGTIGHGLLKAPELIIGKARKATTTDDAWQVYHKALGATDFLKLNTTAARVTAANRWNNTSPTSSAFTVGPIFDTKEYVFYCFHSTDILKVFSYSGNGSSDGPYIDLGGKVLSVPFLKRVDSASNWFGLDTVRDPSNPMSAQLYPNLANAESSVVTLDACANGLKFRTASAPNDGGTYIGLAILGCHGKYS